MGEPIMDNPLSPPSPSPKQIYTKTISDITESINELKKDYEDSGFPLGDDNQCLHRMCAKLEYLLHTSIKPRTGLLGKKKDYWDFYCDCLSSNKSLNDGIKFVKSLSELKTSLGRGRAFMRFALVHQRLADTIQQCICNVKLTSEWYHPQAVWFQQNLVSELISSLYDLNEIKFDLAPRGYDLDMTWPTYARPGFGATAAHSWNPRSRTTSISSLSSIPTLEIYPSSLPSSDLDPSRFDQSFSTTEQDTLEQLDKMENEKIAAEAKAEEYQKKCEELEKELKEERDMNKSLQTKVDSLNQEHIQQRDSWSTETKDLQTKLVDTEASMVELSGTMGRVEEAMGQSMEVTELKMKVLTQDKQMLALQLNLKSTNIELEQKTALEEKKSRLIELLDKKLTQTETDYKLLQSKKQYLFDMCEELIKDKEAQAYRLKDATKQINMLVARKDDLEKMNLNLAEKCKELQVMLNDLQGKGSQIAKIALEKVKKYKEQNESLQGQLSAISNGDIDLEQQLLTAKSTIETQQSANTLLCQSQLMELHTKLADTLEKVNKDSKSDEMLQAVQNLEAMNKEMKTAMEAIKSDQAAREERNETEKGELQKKIVEVERENKELLDHIAGAKQFQEGASSNEELEDLRGKLSARDAEVSKLSVELNSLKGAIASLIGGGQDETQLTPTDTLDTTNLLHAMEAKLKDVNSHLAQQKTMDALTPNQLANEDMEASLKDNESLLTELQEKVEDLSKEIGARLQERDEMKAKYLESVQEKELVIQNSRTENESLQNQVKRLISEKTEIKEQMDNFQEDTEMLKESHRAIVEDKMAAEKTSQEYAALVTVLESEKQELTDHFNDSKKEVESLTGELSLASSEKNKLLDDLAQLEMDILASQSASQDETDMIQQSLQEIKEEKSTLKQKICDLESIISAKDLEVQTLVQRSSNEEECLSQTVNTLKHQVEEIGMQKNELEVKLTATIQEKERFEDLHHQIQAELAESETVRNSLNAQVLELNTEMNENQMKLQELSFVDKAFHDVAKEKAVLENKVADLENELKIISEALHKAHIDVKEGQLMSETEAGDGSVGFHNIPDIRELETENVTLRDRLVNFLQEKDKTFRNLIEEKSDLKEKLDAVNKTLALHGDTNKLLQVNKEEKDALDKQVEMALTEIKKLGDKLTESEEALMKVHEDLRLSEDARQKEVEELTADLDATRDAMGQRERVWDNARESMETEISTLKFQLSSSQMEFNNKLQTYESERIETTGLCEQLTDHAKLVMDLEHNLQSLRQEKEGQTEEYSIEVSRMKTVVLQQESDILKSKKNIQELQCEIQEEHHSKIVIQAELMERKREIGEVQAAYQQECSDLKHENTALKKKVIQLIREKDSLWQISDKLEYAQRQRGSEIWMDDGDVKNCLGCNAEFSIRLRKHHCRRCGKIFCHPCSNNLALTASSSKKERVCNACFMDAESVMSQSLETSGSIESDRQSLLDELLESEEIPVKKSPKWLRAEREVDNQIDEGNEDDDKDDDDDDGKQKESDEVSSPPDSVSLTTEAQSVQPSEDAEETVQPAEEDIYSKYAENEDEPSSISPEMEESPKPQGALSSVTRATLGVTKAMMGVAKAAVTKAASYTPGLAGNGTQQCEASTNDTTDTAEVNPSVPVDLNDDNSQKDNSLAGVRRDHLEEDEPFDIVTHEEIATSSLDALPDPNVISRLTITAKEIADQGGMELEPDLWISAGKSYAVPVVIEKEGITIHWEFTTQPKGIHFGVTFRGDEFSSICEELIAPCKCNSHKQCVVGELDARKPGLYTLIFDNMQSRFTSKKLSLKITVQDC